MAYRLLFLLGGSEGGILDTVAEEFVPAAGRRDAAIALLMVGGKEWERYLAQYVQAWEKRGATQHHVIVPGDDGILDVGGAIDRLRTATGIFIAGGQTSRYQELYASEPIGRVIRERHSEGIPVAGLSAGALICPDFCLLRPTPRNPDEALRIVPGLGLLSQLVVEVHFTEGLGALPTLLESMNRTQARRGLGIGESACAVFKDGRLRRVLGRGVYEVTMTDFPSRQYTMTEADPGS